MTSNMYMGIPRISKTGVIRPRDRGGSWVVPVDLHLVMKIETVFVTDDTDDIAKDILFESICG